MLYNPKPFDETRDLEEVVSGLSTDLNLALETGAVMSTGVSYPSNELTDTANIVGRIYDVFDAMDASRTLSDSFKAVAAKSSKKAAASSGTTTNPMSSAEPTT